MRNLPTILWLAAALTAPAFAQAVSDSNAQSKSKAPDAFVYVSVLNPGGTSTSVVGFSAAPNGSLTPVPGSPFSEDEGSMAVNGKYLMAGSYSSPSIDAFTIQSDGSLVYANSTNYAQYNDPGGPLCGNAGYLFFDHTGADLYVQEFNGTPACSNDLIASFELDKSNGSLNYLGDAVDGAFPGISSPAFFIGDNQYAYAAVNSGCMYVDIYGFQRQSNGLLNYLGEQYNNPAPPPSFRAYSPDLLAADPTTNLAVIEVPSNPPGCAPGKLQLATYTVDGSGNLNTNSTYQNMPSTLISGPIDMKMSPSGELLAIGGEEGLQVFHMNGSSPITHYTGLLTQGPINEMFWDNNNHLYAISTNNNELFVFTITPTGHHMDPGSPYTVDGPQYLIVQPLPLD